MYNCEICKLKIPTLKDYVEHFSLHKHRNNIQFKCAFTNCSRKFKNYNSFKCHVYRDHKPKPTIETDITNSLPPLDSFMCKFCKIKQSDIPNLLSHMRSHIANGIPMECPFTNCTLTFQNTDSFKSHVRRSHYTKAVGYESVFNMNNNVVPITFDIVEPSYLEIPSNSDSNPISGKIFPDVFLKNLALFYLKLQAKFFIPSSTVQSIIDEFQEIHNLGFRDTIDKIKQALSTVNIPSDELNVMYGAIESTDLLSLYNNTYLKTDHLRKMFFKEHFSYIEPKEIYLGKNKFNKYSYAQYVPIKETLKYLFMQKEVRQQHADTQNRKTEQNVLSDILDGTVFKDNILFKNSPEAIKFILFQDAFETVNPLGSAKKKHKILAVYMTFADLLPFHRLNLDVIQLVLLCKENDLKYFGQKKVFSQLISDLKDLESGGIQLYDGMCVKGSVISIIGDNLGSHTIGGFAESFSANNFCRYCLISSEELQRTPYFIGELRTPKNYEELVSKIDQDGVLSKGIKFRSVFNDLKYFHVCTPGLPPCVGHDLFEGIVAYDLALFIKYFIKVKKLFSYSQLNYLIVNFKYLYNDMRNKPNEVNENKLVGHAAQNWCLLRLFPLIVGNQILDYDDEVWDLVLKLREIVDLVAAPKITTAQVAYLKVLIMEYLSFRVELFPDVNLKPKHHFLVHYPELIMQFGPLLRVCTLRFESKHCFFKKCARMCQNFKNITSTLAKRHQLQQAFNNAGNLFPPLIDVSNAVEFHDEIYNEDIRKVILKYGFSSKTTIASYNVVIKGITYKKGLYVILKQDDNKLQVGEIVIMFVHNDIDLIFIVDTHEAVFQSHLGVYQINKNANYNMLTGISYHDLIDFYPLPCYKVKDNYFVPFHHSFSTFF